MFQFTNTIVLNSLVDSSGLSKIVSRPDGLEIRRVNYFKKGNGNVVTITKRAAEDPVLSQATITLPATVKEGFYRLKLYIRLSGSENSFYANDFAIKGKPLYYEFSVKAEKNTKAEVARDIVNIIHKLQNLYGDKWINASLVGSASDQVLLRGIDEFQVFTDVKLERLTKSGNNDAYNKEYYDEIGTTGEDSGYAVALVRGKEGFGTYIHILKDLRLPTMEHLRFEAHNQEELPVPGAKYDQFVLQYTVPRGLFGGAAVGQQVISSTTHVFYVNQMVSAEFEAALTKAFQAPTEIKAPSQIVSVSGNELPMENTNGTATLSPSLDSGSAEHTTVQTSAEWISVEPGTTTATIKADNNEGAERSADVTVVTVKEKNKGVASKKIKVSQNAGA